MVPELRSDGERPVTEQRGGLRASFRLLPRTGRALTVALTAVAAWESAVGPAYAVATGALISSAAAAASRGTGSDAGRRAVLALAVVSSLFLLDRLLGPLKQLVIDVATQRFRRLLQLMLLEAVDGPTGIAHLEDSQIADRLAMARGDTTGLPPSMVVPRLVEVGSVYASAALSGVILFTFSAWAPFVIAAGVVLERLWVSREIHLMGSGYESATAGLRRAGYFRDLTLTSDAAKETRVFGLGPWFIGRFRDSWLEAMTDVWRRRRALRGWAVMGVLGVAATQAGVAIAIALAGAQGDISVGRVAVYLGAASGMMAAVWNADSEFGLRLAARAVPRAVALHRELAARPASPHPETSVSHAPTQAIVFEDTRFAYPRSDQQVLDGLSVEVPAGRSLAIVGQNGAGKTTLVKLLARLYEPASGRITVDGIDLHDLDVEGWRRHLAVVFQDFGHYEVTARDNIAFGALHATDETVVEPAVARADAAAVIDQLPEGLDTILSKHYRGGVDLSGGQWQRIALARAMAAVEGGASVLILDEPTASLDVRAEAELFDRFLDLTRGLTTILISHRFSSVRHADRIAVIEEGRVIELGSHDELMALGGRYATMFNLQADRFRELPL